VVVKYVAHSFATLLPTNSWLHYFRLLLYLSSSPC
jgi:hypothetical protein